MAGGIVEYKEALSLALGEAFENVDGVIDLSEKVVRVEIPVTISASFEDDSGFPGESKDVSDKGEMMSKRGDSLITIVQSSPIRCQKIRHH